MKRRVLEKLKLTEISGVDRPCQEGACVAIMKRAPDATDALALRIQKLKKQVAYLNKKFDPNQPRDDAGRWSEVAGASASVQRKELSGYAARQISRMSTGQARRSLRALSSLIYGTDEGLHWVKPEKPLDWNDPKGALKDMVEAHAQYIVKNTDGAADRYKYLSVVHKDVTPTSKLRLVGKTVGWGLIGSAIVLGITGGNIPLAVAGGAFAAVTAAMKSDSPQMERKVSSMVDVMTDKQRQWVLDCLTSYFSPGSGVHKFDPDQKRDEQGRWSRTGAALARAGRAVGRAALATAKHPVTRGVARAAITGAVAYGTGRVLLGGLTGMPISTYNQRRVSDAGLDQFLDRRHVTPGQPRSYSPVSPSVRSRGPVLTAEQIRAQGLFKPAAVAGTTAQTKASVSFMITRDMKQQLLDLGFNREAIGHMTPQMANDILGKRFSKRLPASTRARLLQQRVDLLNKIYA